MLPRAHHRATAIIAGVLLATLVALLPLTRAQADEGINCEDPILSGAKANTTLIIDGANRTYPTFKSTTEYEIPSAWPGAAALLESPEGQNYDTALRCFIASWPLNEISQVGEYRAGPPTVEVKEAPRGSNATQPTPGLIVLRDEVVADLNSRTAPPLLGPWKVTPEPDHIQFQLISTAPKQSRPAAFDRMIWTAHAQLIGLHFDGVTPKPVSTDNSDENRHQASWTPVVGAKSGTLAINAKLDLATRVAITSNSGIMDALHYTLSALATSIFYIIIIVLLRRPKFPVDKSPVGKAVRAARRISIFGFVASIFRAATYWWYGKDTGFNHLGMPVTYWKWSGLVGIWTVGLVIILIGSIRWKQRVVERMVVFFAAILIVYGTIVLTVPGWFNLEEFFVPQEWPAGLGTANIRPAGGQLALMILLTGAILFVTMATIHCTLHFMRGYPNRKKHHRLPPLWTLLASSLLLATALIGQWLVQQVEFWNRNHVFPVLAADRSSKLIAGVTSGMVTYHLDSFAEFVMNSVPLAAVAATFCVLYARRNRQAEKLGTRPEKEDHRLLGILSAAIVTSAGSWYVGFTIPVTFITTFMIVDVAFPLTRRFSPLKKFYPNAPRESEPGELLRELITMKDLRNRLVTHQIRLDALRNRAQNLSAKLGSRKLDPDTYMTELARITTLLAERQFSLPPVTTEPGQHSENHQAQGSTNGLVGEDHLLLQTRPADVALAIGPRNDWWHNGVLAAKIGAWLGLLPTIYFTYLQTEAGGIGAFYSYLGTLRLLWYMMWQFGFWVIAAFVLGCLWTTLPGRQGLTKGFVVGMGFAIPSAIDYAFGRGLLHQDLVTGALQHITILLLVLCSVGFMFDWRTLRDGDTFRINQWQPLITLYRARKLGPVVVTAVTLLMTLISTIFQVKTGLVTPDVPQPSSTPPLSGGTKS